MITPTNAKEFFCDYFKMVFRSCPATFAIFALCFVLWSPSMFVSDWWKTLAVRPFVLISAFCNGNVSSILTETFWSFTAMFAHVGFFGHLVPNMITLLLLAPALERTLGARWFLLCYLLSGLMANGIYVAALALGINPEGYYYYSLGASGAIFGLMGAVFVFWQDFVIFEGPPSLTLKVKNVMAFVLSVETFLLLGNLLLSRAEQATNEVHIAGFASGFVIAWLLNKFPRPALRIP